MQWRQVMSEQVEITIDRLNDSSTNVEKMETLKVSDLDHKVKGTDGQSVIMNDYSYPLSKKDIKGQIAMTKEKNKGVSDKFEKEKLDDFVHREVTKLKTDLIKIEPIEEAAKEQQIDEDDKQPGKSASRPRINTVFSTARKSSNGPIMAGNRLRNKNKGK